jgi:hypothetical protein
MPTSPRAPRPALFPPGAVLLTAAVLLVATLQLPARFVVLMVLGAGLVVAVVAKPAVAAYAYLGITPLIVGVDRGDFVSILRPNELLMLLLMVGLLARGAWQGPVGWSKRIVPSRLDRYFLLLTVSGSVLPVLWRLLRGATITPDDLLYAMALWKYFALYVMFRASVRTAREVRICLWLAVGAAVVVGLLAILQARQLFGIPQFLMRYYSPFDNEGLLEINRGTSTIASSIAVADVMSFSLAISVTWLLRRTSFRRVAIIVSLVLLLGAVAAGQFSGLIALAIALIVVGVATQSLRRIAWVALPACLIAALLLSPVIMKRAQGFDTPQGVPISWTGRIDNLRTYFWPELFSNNNVLLGVRPAARVEAPERWRQWIFIESGHTWLLWTGGLPFLAAFLTFVYVGIREMSRLARRSDDTGIAAVASLAALWIVAILMTLDAHLTVRGSADLSFPLLAIAQTRGRQGSG